MKVTPVPISNTVVKLRNGNNTWWEAAWEDSKSRVFYFLQKDQLSMVYLKRYEY